MTERLYRWLCAWANLAEAVVAILTFCAVWPKWGLAAAGSYARWLSGRQAP